MSHVTPAQTWAAVAALFVTAMVHFIEIPSASAEATYKAVLFGLNGVGALIAIAGILRGEWTWGWLLGAVVSAGAILGYAASRTIGLPGIPAEPDAWFEPLGVVSVIAEGVFLISFWMARRASGTAITAQP